jgi:hypothetical protein
VTLLVLSVVKKAVVQERESIGPKNLQEDMAIEAKKDTVQEEERGVTQMKNLIPLQSAAKEK